MVKPIADNFDAAKMRYLLSLLMQTIAKDSLHESEQISTARTPACSDLVRLQVNELLLQTAAATIYDMRSSKNCFIALLLKGGNLVPVEIYCSINQIKSVKTTKSLTVMAE
jgi:hypothetical protein